MLTYTIRRLLIMIPTLLVISFVTFSIIKLPPGDFLSNQIAELRRSEERRVGKEWRARGSPYH